MQRSPYRYFLLTLLVIVVDQAVKLLVHFNMEMGFIGQVKVIGDWFKLHYVLNPGMAFGMQIGHEYGKIILSVFRLLAVVGIAYYFLRLARRGAHPGLLWCGAAILGGAIGNVIDSTFYGVFLNNAPVDAPTPWFHGQVIDMFFFDIWEGLIPDWVPIWGGTYYSTPIFNVADAAIFLGVVTILLFQGTFFKEEKPQEAAPDEIATEPAIDSKPEENASARPSADPIQDQPQPEPGDAPRRAYE
jgi:signal peptidase II